MKVGLLGLPESGKTTLFNALTRSDAAVNTFGGRRDEIHLGSVPVPDERFDFAVRVCVPKSRVPAMLEVTDGGAKVDVSQSREKFGADFFAGVRNMDALVLVLRAFESESVLAPDGGIDPRRDAERVLAELLLADLVVAEGRLEKLEKARVLKRITPAESAERLVMDRVKAHLDELKPIRTLELSVEEDRAVRSFAFVTAKEVILAANVGENDLQGSPLCASLREYAAEIGVPIIEFCAKLEMECAQMEPDEEREFLGAMGVSEPARDRLIRAAYAALGYISFFTVGEDEVRAWTVRDGSTAVMAAEKIHTEIARTFIRAETMAFEDFRGAGSWDAAKAAGKMRLEGKEYLVKDGDILHIRNSKG